MPESAQFSLAQAEYFYDLHRSVGLALVQRQEQARRLAQDDQELAMWNFRWRARLRRYNKPFEGTVPGLDQLSGALNAGRRHQNASAASNPLNSLSFQNAELLSELGKIIADPKNVTDPRKPDHSLTMKRSRALRFPRHPRAKRARAGTCARARRRLGGSSHRDLDG